VCLEISEGLKILHCTSDILNIVDLGGNIEITIYGDRDLAGEVVFEGRNIEKVIAGTINDEVVKMVSYGERIVFYYSHLHKNEIVLTIKIN
jgi:hypothetical protein